MKEGSYIYNRKEKVYEPATQYGGGLLEILYHHPVGRMLLKFVIHPFFSRMYGWYNDSPLSKKQIPGFIKKCNICMEDYEDREYKSFNDFFARKIKPGKRKLDESAEALLTPADSKLSLYPIDKKNRLTIKGVSYTLDELVGRKQDLQEYAGGTCLVFRLSVEDYHRYIFTDTGRVKRRYHIKGRLHTGSPISREHKIYRENFRVVNVMQTVNFGEVICIEVGAMLVGKIVNHPIREFTRGIEKGYFEFGGSTIVMLYQKDKVMIDEDIVKHCKDGVEVKLLQGERIGSKGLC